MGERVVHNVPYFKQDAEENCGPAAVQMLLSYYGMDRDQNTLADRLNTGPREGTRTHDVEIYLWNKGLDLHGGPNSRFSDLTREIERGRPAIIDFIDPADHKGHFSLAVGYDPENIIIHDPYIKPYRKIPVNRFLKNWRGQYEPTERWFLSARSR